MLLMLMMVMVMVKGIWCRILLIWVVGDMGLVMICDDDDGNGYPDVLVIWA